MRFLWVGLATFTLALTATAFAKPKIPSHCVEIEFHNAEQFSNLIAALSFKGPVRLLENQKEIDALVCVSSTGNKITTFTTMLLHPKTNAVMTSSVLEVNPNKPDFFYNYDLNRPRFQTQITVIKPQLKDKNSDEETEEDDRPMVAQEKMELSVKSTASRIAYSFTLTQTRPNLELSFLVVKNKGEIGFHFEGKNGSRIQKITFSSFRFRNGIPELGPYRIDYGK